MRRRAPAVVVFAALAVIAAGCSKPSNPLDLGVRRVALDLAFSKEELANANPQQIIQQVDLPAADLVPADAQFTPLSSPRLRPPSRPLKLECDKPAPDATPARPATHLAEGRPEEGSYLRDNDGTIDIDVAAFGLTLPYPPLTTWEISNVHEVDGNLYLSDADFQQLPTAVQDASKIREVEFTLRRNVTKDLYTVEVLRAGPEWLQLVQRSTTTSAGTSVFAPTPPVQIMPLNEQPGTDWSHQGVDRATGIAMTVSGIIVGREVVDVCGTLVDSYRVQYDETVVNLNKTPPETSGNDQCTDASACEGEQQTHNFVNVLFHDGLLLIREEKHFTQRTSSADGLPVTLRWNYVSTIRNMEPGPPGATPSQLAR